MYLDAYKATLWISGLAHSWLSVRTSKWCLYTGAKENRVGVRCQLLLLLFLLLHRRQEANEILLLSLKSILQNSGTRLPLFATSNSPTNNPQLLELDILLEEKGIPLPWIYTDKFMAS